MPISATTLVDMFELYDLKNMSTASHAGGMVDPSQLEKLFKNPLMRSANAISGLFYDAVVVTESDNDRALYAEIYYRLLAKSGDLPSVLFINAQNTAMHDSPSRKH